VTARGWTVTEPISQSFTIYGGDDERVKLGHVLSGVLDVGAEGIDTFNFRYIQEAYDGVDYRVGRSELSKEDKAFITEHSAILRSAMTDGVGGTSRVKLRLWVVWCVLKLLDSGFAPVQCLRRSR
jgi:hypothetical protein